MEYCVKCKSSKICIYKGLYIHYPDTITWVSFQKDKNNNTWWTNQITVIEWLGLPPIRVIAFSIFELIADDRCSKNIHFPFIYLESIYDSKMFLSTTSCHWGIFS